MRRKRKTWMATKIPRRNLRYQEASTEPTWVHCSEVELVRRAATRSPSRGRRRRRLRGEMVSSACSPLNTMQCAYSIIPVWLFRTWFSMTTNDVSCFVLVNIDLFQWAPPLFHTVALVWSHQIRLWPKKAVLGRFGPFWGPSGTPVWPSLTRKTTKGKIMATR